MYKGLFKYWLYEIMIFSKCVKLFVYLSAFMLIKLWVQLIELHNIWLYIILGWLKSETIKISPKFLPSLCTGTKWKRWKIKKFNIALESCVAPDGHHLKVPTREKKLFFLPENLRHSVSHKSSISLKRSKPKMNYNNVKNI